MFVGFRRSLIHLQLEVLRQESEQALGLEKAELRKKQEGLLKAKKEQERQLAKAMKAAASATSSVPSDSEAQKELDGLTVRDLWNSSDLTLNIETYRRTSDVLPAH